MHRGVKKFSKKKESELTLKHHGKHNEESAKLKIVIEKVEEGSKKQGDVMKKRKAKAAKKMAAPRKRSAWKSFWKKYFSF